MGMKITISFKSAGVSEIHAWVDTDRDGKITDESEVQLHRVGDRWTGHAELAATNHQPFGVVWKLSGTADSPFEQDIVRDSDGESVLDESFSPRTGLLAGVAESILGIGRP